jgi:hypothetical protein
MNVDPNTDLFDAKTANSNDDKVEDTFIKSNEASIVFINQSEDLMKAL